ncbi:hypothetical protein Pse7367_1293 [Thalassoporum mexicanum PCC 7367]|nr:hypothetical protein [Pseudanabaena sp. PCC 7367]AFY69587.1 hypothetical protein Pse7367_1293 [Pseudanabaena sp. PCC 7367]
MPQCLEQLKYGSLWRKGGDSQSMVHTSQTVRFNPLEIQSTRKD